MTITKPTKTQWLGVLLCVAVAAFGLRGDIASLLHLDGGGSEQEQKEGEGNNTPSPEPSDEPTITEAQSVTIGELVTISVAGVSHASWSVTPSVPLYVDSNTVTIAFSSPVAGQFVIFAAVTADDRPTALTTSVSVAENEDRNEDDSQHEDASRDAITETVREHLPTSEKEQTKLTAAFQGTIKKIDDGSILTPDGAFAAIRRQTIDCLTDNSSVAFLDALTETLRAENTDQSPTLTDVRALFVRVVDAINAAKPASAPAAPVRLPTPSGTPTVCPSCPTVF